MAACEVFEVDAASKEAVPEKKTYRVEDIQIILDIGRGTAYKLLEQNEFRWFKIGGIYRISKESFDEWLNGIKAVQGDSGHAQATMVTDQYSHILDDDRRVNAELFENAFYSGKVVAPEAAPTEKPESVAEATIPAGVNAELLMKILANPEMAALLKTLAQTLE